MLFKYIIHIAFSDTAATSYIAFLSFSWLAIYPASYEYVIQRFLIKVMTNGKNDKNRTRLHRTELNKRLSIASTCDVITLVGISTLILLGMHQSRTTRVEFLGCSR